MQKKKTILFNELSSKESDLIHFIRTRFRYGKIHLQVRDGEPERILKAWESQELGVDN
jgi:hypothetical protein